MTKKLNQLKGVERPAKLSEQVESQLKDAIYKQVFLPGESLPSENELSQTFSVSRGVVREALLMLSIKGFVKIIKGKGAIITEPSINAVLDPFSQLVDFKCRREGLVYILAVRQMIEPTVCRLAAQHRSAEELERLTESFELMNLNRKDKFLISHYDINFHNIISRSCDNPLVPIVLEPIFHVLSKFHPPIFYSSTVIDTTLAFHEKILNAIKTRDGNQAEKAMTDHLKLTEEHNLRFYSKQGTN